MTINKKQAGNVFQWGTTLVLGATGVSILQPMGAQGKKENIAKETIATKQAEAAKLQAEINVGDNIGSKFVDTKDFINPQGELVTGKYITFDKVAQIKQLKSEIKDTKAKDISLSFSENAATYILPASLSIAATFLAYQGISLIRIKFGNNIDNFCDGVGHKVKDLFKPKTPNEP